jgi:TonB family protein
VKTRAALELWIAKLESYRAARGSLRGLTGRSLAVVLKEPWPFDEWLRSADEWGTPFRVDVGDDGQTYRVISAGADKSFDSGNVAETSPAKDLIAENGRIASGLNVAAYEKKLAAEQAERDRKLIAERAAAPVKAPDGSVAWYVGGDVLPPEAIRKVDPVYPPALREQQAEGFCIVEVVVDEEGNVAYANAVFGKNPEVSKAAVAAIRQWKFKPAMREGKPVRAIVKLTVGFRPVS